MNKTISQGNSRKKLRKKTVALLTAALAFLFTTAEGQYMEKVGFDASDSTNGYYLAIPPSTQPAKGALVFLCNFRNPESLLSETKLHNVAAASGLLTIYVSLGRKLVADPATVGRINTVLGQVIAKYGVDSAKFVLGGYDIAGTIALRYTEMAYEQPSQFPLRPKAVFTAASPVDVAGMYRWSERQIKKNYYPPTVNDAHLYLDMLGKDLGTLTDHPENYKKLTPFDKEDETPGNERWLRQVALRLYYDMDIGWQLATRRNSLYDTDIPNGTELVNRLLLAGNNRAEFMSSRLPGIRSNGMRNASAMSIVDETDCIQWIKRTLHIFDPNNPMAWEAPYKFIVLDGWRMERATIPGPFATHVTLRGMEDIRFPAGWGDAKSEEYWSVAYLFWLDGGQKIDGDVLQKNLKLYYDDLVPGGLSRRNITMPADKIPPAQVIIKKTKTEPDDLETYTGTISMLDYLGQKPMILNYLIHVKSCGTGDHIPVFLEISPKPFDHPIWKDLKKMKEKFSCGE